jgi:hypothetical protein
MKTSRLVVFLLLAAGIGCAQDNPSPAPAAAADAPVQTEMQKWIATTDAQWQAVFKRDVTDVHEAEAKKLMLQYLNLLDDAIAKASKAGDLDGAVALRSEQKRFGDTQLFPEEDQPGDPAAVKQARAAIRALLAKVNTESAVRTKALHAKYDQMLAQAQAQLTQVQRLDDALLVKAKRAEVEAAWLTVGVAIAADANTPGPAPAQTAFPPKGTAKQPSAPAKAATKSDILKVLVGKWHFHWTETGFDADFEFKADGTFIWTPGGKGTWTVADDKIVLEVANQQPKTMQLPLDPAGTKVHDQRKNRNVVAVKMK